MDEESDVDNEVEKHVHKSTMLPPRSNNISNESPNIVNGKISYVKTVLGNSKYSDITK